jgi:hypothetical protein
MTSKGSGQGDGLLDAAAVADGDARRRRHLNVAAVGEAGRMISSIEVPLASGTVGLLATLTVRVPPTSPPTPVLTSALARSPPGASVRGCSPTWTGRPRSSATTPVRGRGRLHRPVRLRPRR